MSSFQNDYPEFPVFKGLQKPLEFFGLRGRYIVWAAISIGGGLLSFLIGYAVFGFIIALILLTAFLAVGGVSIFVKQHKGLHSKKAPKGIYIFRYSRNY
ncbi:MAG: DUF4133 domain-containing protein [Prevotella sp.]|nr:DUF4133 domain-containing protein [Prevotella sp.]